MSEQKRYTAEDFRHAVFARQARMNAVPLVHPTEDELDEMLEQAADAEEELAHLRDEQIRLVAENARLAARLEAVVKECEKQYWAEVETEYACEEHNKSVDAIIRLARGEGDEK